MAHPSDDPALRLLRDTVAIELEAPAAAEALPPPTRTRLARDLAVADDALRRGTPSAARSALSLLHDTLGEIGEGGAPDPSARPPRSESSGATERPGSG